MIPLSNRYGVQNNFNAFYGIIKFLIGAKQKDIGLVEANRIINELERENKDQKGDILPILSKIIKKYRDLADHRSIALELYRDQCKVRGSSLLEELFSHIIENAIIHSGGTKVRISIKKGDNTAVITVEDDGKGITEDKRDQIFEKFWSGKKDICSGLGLYLAKLIAESYGGGIEVKDSDLGGVRFDVILKRVSNH